MGKTAAITIDSMAREDLDQVMAIENASFSMPWSRNLFLSEFRNKPISLMRVALIPGKIREVVGYIVCWCFVDELHILDLAVRPDVRRCGIANCLVVAVLREAYEQGARKAFLEVRESNRPAYNLYRSLGFIQTHVRQDYYDLPIEDALVMKLDTTGFRQLLNISG